jgi:hypothetical protein
MQAQPLQINFLEQNKPALKGLLMKNTRLDARIKKPTMRPPTHPPDGGPDRNSPRIPIPFET